MKRVPSKISRQEVIRRQGGVYQLDVEQVRRDIARTEKLLDEMRHKLLTLEALALAKAPT